MLKTLSHLSLLINAMSKALHSVSSWLTTNRYEFSSFIRIPPQARRRTTTQMELLYANSADPDAPVDDFSAPLLSISESSEGIAALVSSSVDRDLATNLSSRTSLLYVFCTGFYCVSYKRKWTRFNKSSALFRPNIKACAILVHLMYTVFIGL